jgi:hypothetical protein
MRETERERDRERRPLGQMVKSKKLWASRALVVFVHLVTGSKAGEVELPGFHSL